MVVGYASVYKYVFFPHFLSIQCRVSPEITDATYHEIADRTLENMVEIMEAWLEEVDLDDGDVELSQGVLTLKLGELGTYVINKQTPNKQIWMSSPISGPVRYDWDRGAWIYHRDGHAMHSRIEKELEEMTGIQIDLNPCKDCTKLNACTENSYCIKG